MRWPQFDKDAQGQDWAALMSMDTDRPALGPAVSHFPLPGWPAASTVEYLTKLIMLGLLLLAIPYLIGRMLMAPAELLVDLGTARAMKPPG